MKLKAMLKQKAGWLSNTGPSSDIVLSSRVRIARNLTKIPFPARASNTQQAESFNKTKNACLKSNYFKGAAILNLKDYNEIDRQFLMERHLISYEHANGDGMRGLIIGDKELISLMINEEDHLRLQGMQSGIQLKQVWDMLKEIDETLEKRLDYAFSYDIGYLTACPTNTGTGLRASILVHLPALVLTGEIDKVLKALGKIGVVARGLYGEGTRIMGDLFQISNQMTLGQSEEAIIENLESVGKRIVNREIKSRKNLFNEDKIGLEDSIYRAYGVLASCRRISFQETMDLLSKVKLGIYCGLKLNSKLETLNELMILAQPAHLQEAIEEKLSAPQRDVVRADLIRKKLKEKM